MAGNCIAVLYLCMLNYCYCIAVRLNLHFRGIRSFRESEKSATLQFNLLC